MCGKVCPAPAHSAPQCQAGQCHFQCQSPFIPCGPGCVDPRADLNNCGACGKKCPAVPGGMPTCNDGQCSVACASGNSVCDNQCVDTSSDPRNCGQCGNKCKGGMKCLIGLCLL
jgi:hypothetical protein